MKKNKIPIGQGIRKQLEEFRKKYPPIKFEVLTLSMIKKVLNNSHRI